VIRLEPRDREAALHLYRATEAPFPLMGAVLQNRQDGVVHADNAARPSCAYVEHSFGFAQVLGRPPAEFESALERYLLVDKSFAPRKVRLYTPWLPGFLEDPRYDSLRSLRQRFILDPASKVNAAAHSPEDEGQGSDRQVAEVDDSNVAAIEQAFGVTRRFWRSASDFVRGAQAIVAMHRGEPASLCYAAAEADGQVEIDVLTRPEHQRLGLGKLAVSRFLRRCLERGLSPVWDCFANNTASVRLCRSSGFAPRAGPYPFFTIGR
jgi:GNAT superfamily N-acetyltransferase